MDLLNKIVLFEKLATKEVSLEEVTEAQKEAADACEKARKLLEAYSK